MIKTKKGKFVMKNEKIKAISEKLEQLSERQLNEFEQTIDEYVEEVPLTSKEKLFRTVQNAICEISDVKIENKHGVVIGIGTNLIYNERDDENVSLCYMLDADQFELTQNHETLLVITKDSPVLEAFIELFHQIGDL